MQLTKTLTIALLMLCFITGFLFPKSSPISYSDFQKKSDWEKWVYFQTALTEAKRFSEAYKLVSGLYKESEKELKRQLKKDFKPRWGFSITANANLNSNLDGIVEINNSYQIYLFKRFYLSPGASFSFGKNLLNNNQLFGGGISFGFGFIFE